MPIFVGGILHDDAMKRLFLLGLLLGLVGLVSGKRKEGRSLVRLETTAGVIRVALFDETPLHRDNFLRLAERGFYDGTLFHRVIRNFMIQGGDPDSRQAPAGKVLGEGGPGYEIPAEIRLPDLYHWRGALAMAREGDDVNPERRSSGSQFYIVWGKSLTETALKTVRAAQQERYGEDVEIMTRDMYLDYQQRGGTPHLDGEYTVFGEVLDGLKVVKEIQKAETDTNDRPVQDVVLLRAVVEQKSEAALSASALR